MCSVILGIFCISVGNLPEDGGQDQEKVLVEEYKDEADCCYSGLPYNSRDCVSHSVWVRSA